LNVIAAGQKDIMPLVAPRSDEEGAEAVDQAEVAAPKYIWSK
jgi:hypothetical protein